MAVGAHMDDVEIGVGGILCQAVLAGHRFVSVVVASDHSSWKMTAGHEDEVRAKQIELAERYGYEKRFLEYAYHNVQPDNDLKRKLAEIYVEVEPDITLVHHDHDHWPDHVNSGIAAKDAVLFSHGYTDNKTIQRCPRVFAYNTSPAQTFNFEPDFFVVVDDVIKEYMELMIEIDLCLPGTTREELVVQEVRNLDTGLELSLGSYGRLKHAQCLEWGDMNGTRGYAIGLKTLWGPKDGRPLW
jgi:hypothetical protein